MNAVADRFLARRGSCPRVDLSQLGGRGVDDTQRGRRAGFIDRVPTRVTARGLAW